MYFLFRHKNNVHGNRKLKKFQCEFCPFSTHARDYLYEHRSDFSIKRLTRLTQIYVQRVPALRVFWDLEKTVLHETRVSGTVLWSPTNTKSPTYTDISQKTC